MNQPIDVLADDFETRPPVPVDQASRLRAMQEAHEAGVICSNCGGNWFYEVTCNRYEGTRYSSAPGGDMSVISSMAQHVRICLCGHVFSPNLSGMRAVRASQEISSFMRSIESSQKARNFETAVSKVEKQNHDLRQQIQLLEAQLAQVKASFAPAPAAVQEASQAVEPSSGPIVPDAELLSGLNSWNNEGENGETKRGPGRPKKAA